MKYIVSMTKTLLDRTREYYRGERVSNAILVLCGAIGMIWMLSVYMWRHGNLSRGMFYSTVPLALFLIITGGYRFVRSFRRYSHVKEQGETYIKEVLEDVLTERLQRFYQKRRVDLLMILGSAVMGAIGLLRGWHHVTVGTTISIFICSVVLLIYDLFGQFRTEEILYHIKKK